MFLSLTTNMLKNLIDISAIGYLFTFHPFDAILLVYQDGKSLILYGSCKIQQIH